MGVTSSTIFYNHCDFIELETLFDPDPLHHLQFRRNPVTSENYIRVVIFIGKIGSKRSENIRPQPSFGRGNFGGSRAYASEVTPNGIDRHGN